MIGMSALSQHGEAGSSGVAQLEYHISMPCAHPCSHGFRLLSDITLLSSLTSPHVGLGVLSTSYPEIYVLSWQSVKRFAGYPALPIAS